MAANYPSQWFGGKPRGSIITKGNTYLARISPPNEKQIAKFFRFRNNVEEETQLAEAKKWLKEESDRLNLTVNMMRFTDKDTIEVISTMDKTFKTDAKNMDLVEKYKIQTVHKKEKNKFYIMCQDVKDKFPLTNLLCNYKIIEYIDGNTLNLCLSNLKEFGAIKPKETKDEEIKYDVDQYEFFNVKIKELPFNTWILGKPSGTVFKRGGQDKVYTARVQDDGGAYHEKTFSIDTYGSDEKTKTEAVRWQYNTSYQLGVTKNLIKLIDKEFIEVMLTREKSMTTDIVFLPLIQKIPLFVTHTGQ